VIRSLAVGGATTTIEVGTGITYAFTRPSLAMASQAMDVQRLLDGRFTLGLGTGTRGIRRIYGAEFDPAATRFGSYVRELRAEWERTAEEGWPDPPPVYGAGLNPAMLRAVARNADGVVLHPLALVRLHLHERVLPALEEGRASADPGLEGRCRIAAWYITSIDEDEEIARSHARRQLAFYLSTPSYKPVLEGGPWLSVADEVRAAFDAAKPNVAWTELESIIPDELVDELTLWGTESGVRSQAVELEAELAAAGVDELVFQTVGVETSPEATISNCEAIVRSLAPV